MKLIENVGATIKLMKMENGLNLLDYGRLRKAGEINSYGSPRDSTGQIGDYAFLFDMMIILCHHILIIQKDMMKNKLPTNKEFIEEFVKAVEDYK